MEEVKFINNQVSLRKYATESLGMIMPNDQRIYLPRGAADENFFGDCASLIFLAPRTIT